MSRQESSPHVVSHSRPADGAQPADSVDKAGFAPGAHPRRERLPRWTRGRWLLTLGLGTIGFFSGYLLGLIDGVTIGELRREATLPFLFLTGVILALPLLGVYRAAYGTCRSSPVTQAGTCLGLFLGAQMRGVVAFAGGAPWPVLVGGTLLGLCLAAAGWFGGRRGVRHRFGPPSLGVGAVCAHCGYDLAGSPEHTVCPECGGAYRFASAPP